MKPGIEVSAIDCLTLRLFEAIDERNMPWLRAAGRKITALFGPALVDLVPSYTTLMVHYDLSLMTSTQARACLARAVEGLEAAEDAGGTLHRVPVWYDPSVGPELELIAGRAGLTVQQVIDSHCAHDYQVFALGFAPGFAFMGLVEERLATPRLKTPRKRVAAGSVGIADRQTAAYPLQSPGGWNLIGRTPMQLFDYQRDGYSLLRPGDRVRFEPIDRAGFLRLGGDDTAQATIEGATA
ncbi:5-oxoprolinase subunit PxpB [Pseudomonas stutzeri]|uniref:5-oxoprolinase subunit PxpB n=1 Tax=Stutzerimonas stutzeri TaxID=316 RepID=UPI00210C1E2B|nr:5-oxoprolinase subunit PxpB [Stutzerimonas stutzeri]MCQ4313392.1 5-oxoprolinase subunit PxpB [Stutzerimonas stutzeri]